MKYGIAITKKIGNMEGGALRFGGKIDQKSGNVTLSSIYLNEIWRDKKLLCQDIYTLRSQLRSTCVIYTLGKSVFPQYVLVCICKYFNLTVTICSRHRVIQRFNFPQIIPTIDPWLITQLVYNLYLNSIKGPWIVD